MGLLFISEFQVLFFINRLLHMGMSLFLRLSAIQLSAIHTYSTNEAICIYREYVSVATVATQNHSKHYSNILPTFMHMIHLSLSANTLQKLIEIRLALSLPECWWQLKHTVFVLFGPWSNYLHLSLVSSLTVFTLPPWIYFVWSACCLYWFLV